MESAFGDVMENIAITLFEPCISPWIVPATCWNWYFVMCMSWVMTSYIEFCIVPQQVMIYLPHESWDGCFCPSKFPVGSSQPVTCRLLGFWAMAISCYPKAFQTTIKLNSKVVALKKTAGGYGWFSLNSKVVALINVALIKVAGGVGFLPFQTEKNNMSILWRQFCSFGALTYLRYHFLFGRCYFLFAVCVFVVSHRAAESPGVTVDHNEPVVDLTLLISLRSSGAVSPWWLWDNGRKHREICLQMFPVLSRYLATILKNGNFGI